MAEKTFVAIGGLLFNPELLAYAAFEDDEDGPRLRLGFATTSGASARSEVRLSGKEAGVAVRWLRLHTTPLTQAGVFGPNGRPVEGSSFGRPIVDRMTNPVTRVIAISTSS